MKAILKILQFVVEYVQDLFFAVRYNTYSPFEERNRRFFYRITILTHAIEKGLSLNHTRPLFGQQKIHSIMDMIQTYDRKFSTFPLEMVRGALEEYLCLHQKLGIADPFLDEVETFLSDTVCLADIEPSGGIKLDVAVSKTNRQENLAFLRTRFSCRSFAPEVVPALLVETVVAAAQWAPSQCNRQSVRVHAYSNRDTICEMLIEQGGAKGVYEGVYNLFVITSETTAWGGVGQRNQGYIDGGLLAYGLMLSTHAYGIATCALNLAVSNVRERKIKAMGAIPMRERLIMMIAYGYPDQTDLKAARSPRLPASFVLTQHD